MASASFTTPRNEIHLPAMNSQIGTMEDLDNLRAALSKAQTHIGDWGGGIASLKLLLRFLVKLQGRHPIPML